MLNGIIIQHLIKHYPEHTNHTTFDLSAGNKYVIHSYNCLNTHTKSSANIVFSDLHVHLHFSALNFSPYWYCW